MSCQTARTSIWLPLLTERQARVYIPGAGRRRGSPILLRKIGFHVKEEALALFHLVFQLLRSLHGLGWERRSASGSMAGVRQGKWKSPSPAGTPVGTLWDREKEQSPGWKGRRAMPEDAQWKPPSPCQPPTPSVLSPPSLFQHQGQLLEPLLLACDGVCTVVLQFGQLL